MREAKIPQWVKSPIHGHSRLTQPIRVPLQGSGTAICMPPGEYTLTVRAVYTVDGILKILSESFTVTVTALAPHNVTVTVGQELAGTVLGGGAFMPGKSVTVSAVANPGYAFVKWTLDSGAVVSSSTVYTFLMGYEDITLTANFRQSLLAITSPLSNLRAAR